MIDSGTETEPDDLAGDMLILGAHAIGIVAILVILAAVMWRVG